MKKTTLNNNQYISHYCSIANGRIWLDGQQIFEAAGVPSLAFLEKAYRGLEIDYPKFFKMDKLSKLGFLAAEVLLRSFARTEGDNADTGIVLTNSQSSLDADVRYMETVKTIPSPAIFVYTLPNIVIGEISIRHKLKGENAFFVMPAFDASFVSFMMMDMMRHRGARACLGGWCDIFEEEYAAFMVLAENGNGSIELNEQHLNDLYNSTWNS